MQKAKTKKLIMAALIISLGGAVFYAASNSRANSAGQDDAEVQVPSFRYELIQPDKVTITAELSGRVSAFMVSEVRPQVSGVITERLFTEGSDVAQGQVLYQIDPAVFEAAYGNAQATLTKAEANERSTGLLASRYAKLVKNGAISEQEHDDAVAAHRQAKADVESARQALETARINLDYTQIKAPVSGTIGRSLVTPGALATQHQAAPLAVIQQLDQVYVDLTYSNRELLQLRRAHAKGDLEGGSSNSAKIKLRLEDGSVYSHLVTDSSSKQIPEPIEGELLFSDVTIEQSTGMVNVRALFKNPDRILLPGMYVRAIGETGSRDDAVLVSQKVVMRDNRDRTYVYVLSKKRPEHVQDELKNESQFYVEMRLIQLDGHYNNKWLVSDGLLPGERVLVEGLQKVRPGMIVTGAETVLVDNENNSEQAR